MFFLFNEYLFINCLLWKILTTNCLFFAVLGVFGHVSTRIFKNFKYILFQIIFLYIYIKKIKKLF
jgi:hypothetical protein